MKNNVFWRWLPLIIIVIILAGCAGTQKEVEPSLPEDPTGGPSYIPEQVVDSLDELRLNWAILEKLGAPFADILRDEPSLEPRFLDAIDATALCFVDPSKTYSYILFVTQYLPYNDTVAEAIEKFDIRCAGIYTTVGEMFPEFTEGEHPVIFFERFDVENLYVTDFKDHVAGYGLAYSAYFWYKGMLFQLWGGTTDSPVLMSAKDFVTVEVPTDNENIINNYFNDKLYPDK